MSSFDWWKKKWTSTHQRLFFLKVRDKANSATKSSAISIGEEKIKSETVERDKNVSDDDKIRLQLFVDVKHYLKTMESLGVQVNEVTEVNKLESLVTEATKSCIWISKVARFKMKYDFMFIVVVYGTF